MSTSTSRIVHTSSTPTASQVLDGIRRVAAASRRPSILATVRYSYCPHVGAVVAEATCADCRNGDC